MIYGDPKRPDAVSCIDLQKWVTHIPSCAWFLLMMISRQVVKRVCGLTVKHHRSRWVWPL